MSNEERRAAHDWLVVERWPSSWLYVPCNKPQLFDKAATSDAEALILDLEDAVPLPAKDQARRDLAEWLENRGVGKSPGLHNEKPVWVRINAEHVEDDLSSLFRRDGSALCTGVILAKSEPTPLARVEQISQGRLPVIGLVESAAGLKALDQMSASRSVVTFGIGEVDLLADLRIERRPSTETVVDTIRLQVVMACAAFNLRAPLAPTSTDVNDIETFAITTQRFLDLGFRGRTAIHPKQASVINKVFIPSSEDIDAAREVVDRFEQASDGVTLDESGRLIDAAVVRSAVELLERASIRQADATSSGRPK